MSGLQGQSHSQGRVPPHSCAVAVTRPCLKEHCLRRGTGGTGGTHLSLLKAQSSICMDQGGSRKHWQLAT